MKKANLAWALFFLAVATISYLAWSGVIQREWAVLVQGLPAAEYPSRLDMGDCEAGKTAIKHFVMQNRGGGDLLIDNIKTNCSCSGLEKEEEGQFVRITALNIPAGESVALRVRVQVPAYGGNASRNAISFQTNDPHTIEGRIEFVIPRITGGVSALPQTIMLESVMSDPSEPQQVVEVWDDAPRPRRVIRVVSPDSKYVSVRLLGEAEYKRGEGEKSALVGKIEVKLHTMEIGEFRGAVQVFLAEEEHSPVSPGFHPNNRSRRSACGSVPTISCPTQKVREGSVLFRYLPLPFW